VQVLGKRANCSLKIQIIEQNCTLYKKWSYGNICTAKVNRICEGCLQYIRINNTVNIWTVVRCLSVCLTSGPQPLLKPVLHSVRSSASAFNFLRKVWPVRLPFLYFILCRIFPSSLTLCKTLFSHERSKWFYTSFSRNTFQNFPVISDLLFEVSKFQRHINVCSKCKIFSLSLNLCPFCW